MQKLPPKKDVALALLERSSLFIHLDPRAADVQVPKWFQKQPQLVLQVGLNMPVPIRDLEVGDEAISCTLSFNRTPHFCWLPWEAIYALVGEEGQGMVWPDDVPPEVAAQAGSAAGARAKQKPVRKKPALRAVSSTPDPEADEAADGEQASAPEVSAKRHQRPQLRAVPAPEPEPASEAESTLALAEGVAEGASASEGAQPATVASEPPPKEESQEETVAEADSLARPAGSLVSVGEKQEAPAASAEPALAEIPSEPEQSSPPSEPPAPKRGSHLRLVK